MPGPQGWYQLSTGWQVQSGLVGQVKEEPGLDWGGVPLAGEALSLQTLRLDRRSKPSGSPGALGVSLQWALPLASHRTLISELGSQRGSPSCSLKVAILTSGARPTSQIESSDHLCLSLAPSLLRLPTACRINSKCSRLALGARHNLPASPHFDPLPPRAVPFSPWSPVPSICCGHTCSSFLIFLWRLLFQA